MPMTRLLPLLLACACAAPFEIPPMGDPAYQSAAICAPAAYAPALQAAADEWHAALPRVTMTVEPDADGCPIEVHHLALGAGIDGGSGPGSLIIPGAPSHTMLVHELGHFLIGNRYPAPDTSHSTDPASVMNLHSGPGTVITEQDKELVP